MPSGNKKKKTVKKLLHFKKAMSSRMNYVLANIHLFKGNNRNARKRCEMCSKLTIKTSE